MKRVFVAICLCFGCTSHLFAEKAIFPAIMIEPITVTDVDTYGKLVAAANARMKKTYAVPLFLRAYTADSLSGGIQSAFALSPALEFDNLLKNEQLFASDPEFRALREEMAAVSKSAGAKTYLKAVRFDGTHTPGFLFNSLVTTKSEAALLSYLNEWILIFDEMDLDMPKVNVFRVVIGEGAFTHLVSLNFGSTEAMGCYLDAVISVDGELNFILDGDAVSVIEKQAIYSEVDTFANAP